jgi:cell wall-associated NlpC family hydrolase
VIVSAVRGAIAFVFGDEIFRIVLYVVAGVGCFVVLEAFGSASAIFGQPWGQWWAAGQFGPSLVHNNSGDTSFVGGGTSINITTAPNGFVSDFTRYRLAADAGFSGQSLLEAVAVSIAEDDNGDPARQHTNNNGTVDTCLWQINSNNAAEFGGVEALKTPTVCAHAAFVIFNRAHGFCPWFTYATSCDPPGVHLHTNAYAANLTRAALASVMTVNPWYTDAIAYAQTWLDVPYFFGGCSRSGIDCSCYVQNVLAHVGISAPRTTVQQIAWAHRISAADAVPGDLVFFDDTCTNCGANPTHEGMFIGDGRMIDAGGTHVQINSITSGFYAAHNPRFARVP